MIAAWMVASTVVALLLVGAAMVAQRVLGLYRGVPLRWAWAAALMGTCVASALWMARPGVGAPAVASGAGVTGVLAAAPTPPFRLPALPPGVDHALVVAWILASLTLVAALAFAAIRLRNERRNWTDGVVDRTPVGISESTGPAALGVLRPRVVIPQWVLALERPAQDAIVAHEREHLRARDPALLVAALSAVVLMPWNVGAWLAWRGLRRAVEFDCDARVLRRGVDRVDYASILISASIRTPSGWLGAAALTRESGLGARIQHLMRREPRRRTMKAFLGTALALGLVIVACDAPAPQQIVGTSPPAKEVEVTAERQPSSPLIFVDGVKWTGTEASETALTLQRDAERHYLPSLRVRGMPLDRSSSAAGPALEMPPVDQIQSIEVVKGGAAAAMYGPQAEQGVILITTKGSVKR